MPYEFYTDSIHVRKSSNLNIRLKVTKTCLDSSENAIVTLFIHRHLFTKIFKGHLHPIYKII